MPKQVYGVEDDSGLYAAGALLFASYLLEMGLSDADVLARLGSRFPDASSDALSSVLATTLQGQQAASEIEGLPPGFTIPPTGIPAIPGVPTGGYIVEIIDAIDDEGNEVGTRREIDVPEPIPFDEIFRRSIPVSDEVWEKYIEDFIKRGWKKLKEVRINILLAWQRSILQ